MSGFSAYQVGQVVRAVSAKVDTGVTKPPRRYTQDSLIDDMLNAHKFAASDAERKVLLATEGLGTSRTREPTITNLISRGFLTSTKKGKKHELVSTGFARETVGRMPGYLTSVATTAKWEVAFGMIEKGTVQSSDVLVKISQMVHGVVSDAKARKGMTAA